MIDSVSPTRASRWRHLPAVLLALALVFLTIAMAGPSLDRKIPRNRAVVMLVMDVSTSMDATDVPPTRMKASQEAAKKFADDLTPGVNLGLISYAANPHDAELADHQPRRHQDRHRQDADRRAHRHR